MSPLVAVVRWYFHEGAVHGLPFYCDPTRIGGFAVEPNELAAGNDRATFRLFITLSMYQALRDVVIMRQQRSLSHASVRVVADAATLRESIAHHVCPMLGSVDAFEQGCDVGKDGDDVDCSSCPGEPCPVKDATRVFNRMGDMGKLPTSAWLRLWRGGGMQALLDEICRKEPLPTRRATLLVGRFAAVHRVGRKLATMFVSALSTPALAPGLTPWFPEVDGNELVVVDTNVARAVDTLRGRSGAKTYDARERWVRVQAAKLDLRMLRPKLPAYSPRLVQEALYAFCSKSNRIARRDACAERSAPCATCTPTLCPFIAKSQLRQDAS
jgi:hypothetical protein